MTCRHSSHSGTYSGWLKGRQLLWLLNIKRFLGILSDLQESLRDLGGRQDRLSTGSVPLSSGKCMYVISYCLETWSHSLSDSDLDVYSCQAFSPMKFFWSGINTNFLFLINERKGHCPHYNSVAVITWSVKATWCVITICHQDLPAMGDYGAVCD